MRSWDTIGNVVLNGPESDPDPHLCLMDPNPDKGRPKNMRILRIWIRITNTGNSVQAFCCVGVGTGGVIKVCVPFSRPKSSSGSGTVEYGFQNTFNPGVAGQLR